MRIRELEIKGATIIRNRHLPFIEFKEGVRSIYAVRKHSHEELSFGFVEKGSSNISCKTLQFELDVNQAILLPADTVHLCQPDDMDKFIFKMLYILETNLPEKKSIIYALTYVYGIGKKTSFLICKN